LNSNDPDMQLAWAQDTLVYVGVCADNEERIAAAKPGSARSATPRLEHQLKVDAMNITTFLADQHHPKAEFLRGMWLEWGRFGQREDKKEAFRCYSRAADRGYARAEYRIGMLYESSNDPIKALRHYHRGVDAGDAASCYRLGMMTLRGQHGQQQDFAKGLDLIRRSAQAADENAAQGAYVYGMLLSRQLPQIEIPDGYLQYDERAARINIEKAAYLKFAKAQLKMGSAYELGSLGCSFDPALSMHYYALAAKQGEAEADMGLSKWFLVGSEGLFPKNEELAYTYAERAAAGGLATAEFAMGYFNEIGMHVPVDLDKALEWYQKASKHGNTDAQGRIDGLSRKQVLSRKDHEQVAITRIKSTYGSLNGHRPERFQQEQRGPSRLAQSTTADDAAGGGYGYANGGAPKSANGMRLSSNYAQPPPRGDSITPYPVDNGPPSAGLDNRPGSVAPYPLEDGPPSAQATPRLGPTGGFFNANPPQRPATTVNPVDTRPSSAFQINPDLRSQSASTVPQLPSQAGRPAYAQQAYQYPPYGSASNSRPPATGPPQQQAYRPGPAPLPGPGLRPQGQRVASGPGGMQSYPRPGPASPQSGMLQHPPTAPAPVPGGQRLDIGFSAPPDSRAYSYGPRPQQGAGGYQPGPAATPPLRSNPSMPNFDQSPPSQQAGRSSRPGSRPPDNRTPGSGSSNGSGGPRPPAKDSVSVGAPATKPSTTPKPNTGTSSRPPPGKGPKTFDEMGVPAQKQNSDCVSLLSLPLV
jgi:TPR repeat protein